ncbi:MAG TPA: sigma-70 family RNA polymerase sigma factor, partial [Rikenellaceae bacterium]|nr:sigma-70 family RNA polymerase sigma factor [Rikenellaceae bacterium]
YKIGSVKEAIGLLSRTGRNLEIDEHRKESVRRTVSLEGRQVDDEVGDAMEKEMLFRKVEASVDSELTDLQRVIVRKHEYEGQSFERIAKDLGMRQAAVRMHISRARKILRDKFRNEDELD